MTEQPSTVQHSSKDDAFCLFCPILKSRTGNMPICNFLNLVAIDDSRFHSSMKERSIKKYDSWTERIPIEKWQNITCIMDIWRCVIVYFWFKKNHNYYFIQKNKEHSYWWCWKWLWTRERFLKYSSRVSKKINNLFVFMYFCKIVAMLEHS